ncbi:hypothetical protein [Allokutzneria oryzae]|uniref:Uncharacterized protein n=1 Tax=Allokutzneria oryzae TaxID=1378989 RepID=A0ABV5ZTT6_9PSEU
MFGWDTRAERIVEIVGEAPLDDIALPFSHAKEIDGLETARPAWLSARHPHGESTTFRPAQLIPARESFPPAGAPLPAIGAGGLDAGAARVAGSGSDPIAR